MTRYIRLALMKGDEFDSFISSPLPLNAVARMTVRIVRRRFRREGIHKRGYSVAVVTFERSRRRTPAAVAAGASA